MDGSSWHCTGDRDQDHPQEKEMQKGKMLVWALKIAEKEEKRKRKEKRKDIPIWMKSSKEEQGEIKKGFFSDQCKEIEENNRMWKTRDLFKKIQHTKGTFHAKMGSIKDLILTEIDHSFKWSEVAQSCPTLCHPMDCSLPGSYIYGVFQGIVLEWVAISFSRGSSRPRDRTQVSRIVDRRFTVWATREVSTSIL